MFLDFCLLFTDSFIESIEDDMVNLYFANIDSIEDEYQTKLKDLRFKIFQAQSSGNKKVFENVKKQLDTLERQFYLHVSIVMKQKKKEATYQKVCTTPPVLTFGNPYFREYFFKSEAEDQRLLMFMSKKTF
jgi:hypothetical protein